MLENKRFLTTARLEFSQREVPQDAEIVLCLEAPVESRLPMAEGIIVKHNEVELTLVRGESGLLGAVVLQKQTEPKWLPQWSTSVTGMHQFNERLDPNGTALVDILSRIEGLLFPLGLVTVNFQATKWSWYSLDRATRKKRLLFSVVQGREANRIKRPFPSEAVLRKLALVALGQDHKKELLSLTLFRVGEDNFQDGRYQDALRYFLLGVEHHFGLGKYREKDLKELYLKSEMLVLAINGARTQLDYFVRAGDVCPANVDELIPASNPEAVVERLIRTRGFLFHQSAKRQENWHPSRQIPQKEETIAVRSIIVGVVTQMLADITQNTRA